MKSEHQEMAEGYVGVTPEKLAAMSDAELAIWHINRKEGSAEYLLGKYEWEMRPLRKQGEISVELAKQARISTLLAAALGVLGALLGVIVGCNHN